MKNNSFVFYSSFYECIKTLDDSDKLKIFEAICEYGIHGKRKRVSSKVNAIMELIIPQIEASAKRYNAQVENGKKGGAPKGNLNAKKTTQNNPKTTQNNLKVDFSEQPKNNLNYNDNYNYKYNDNYNVNSNQRENNSINNLENNLPLEDEEKRLDKINFYLDVLRTKLNNLPNELIDIQTINRINSLIELISKKDNFKIQGAILSSVDILSCLTNLFVGSDSEVCDRFAEIFSKVDSACNIQNKFNYTVSVMYNKSNLVVSNC